ncbi:hypothetical protein ACSBR1_007980 [Camellia fascicularis]
MDPHSQNVDSEDYDGDEDEVEEPSATPLWKYVIKVLGEGSSAKPGGGGSMKFICNYGCETVAYTGSYSRADMVSSILNAPKGYKSPNYEKVRTALLDKE